MTPMSRNHNATQPMAYLAYLVRLWQESPNGPWRASAQSVQSGEIICFGSQQALFAFLDDEIQHKKEPTDDE